MASLPGSVFTVPNSRVPLVTQEAGSFFGFPPTGWAKVWPQSTAALGLLGSLTNGVP